jgi:membrane-bound metal-dependent hydrolase YbcI (DUF457 family)
MFLGHVGAALGAKRLVPAATIGALVVATYLPDWADAALCAAGQYRDTQMYSHSIAAVAVLAFLAAGYQIVRGRSRAVATAVALVVISHLLLDYLTGTKPTWIGGPMIGLGLYSHPVIDFALEAAVIALGWSLYRATLPPMPRRWNEANAMLAALLLMQLGADIGRLLFPTITKC